MPGVLGNGGRGGARLESLNCLRALAAFVVFLFHTEWLIIAVGAPSAVGSQVGVVLTGVGHVGVSLFFVLSGFVLTWSYRPGTATREFWRRRAARIYPAHIVTWVIAVGLARGGVMPGTSFLAGLANLALLPHVAVPGATWVVLNPPTWSLESEMLFYALFPLACPLIARAEDAKVRCILGVAVITSIGIPFAAELAGMGNEVGVQWMLYFFPPSRLPEFIAGMALATLLKRGALPRVPVGAAWGVVAGAYLVATFAPTNFTFAAITLVPFSLLIVAYARRDTERSTAGRMPSRLSRVASHLGTISYAFFLTHALSSEVAKWFVAAPPSPLVALAVWFACLATSWASAEVLYRVAERPAQRWLAGRRPLIDSDLDLRSPADPATGSVPVVI